MDIWNTDKLALFIAFVVPGCISLKTYSLVFLRVTKDGSQQIVDAITYSCINYALLALPIYWVEKYNLRENYLGLYVTFYVFAIILMPAAWIFFWNQIRKTQIAQKYLPHPTSRPWDFVFSKRKKYWLIVTLKSGASFGGLFGTNSFVTSTPEPEQIYLEEVWHLNEHGGFNNPKVETAGMLLAGSDIQTIEFFKHGEE
jgi:hypothetical protein